MRQTLNIIKSLDRKMFSPYVVSIYPENESASMKEEFFGQAELKFIDINKFRAVFGSLKEIKRYIAEINPDVIHSVGVFPDYIISRLKVRNSVLTVRSYAKDDFPDAYGKILGGALVNLHLKAVKSCPYKVACSKSLSEIYKEKFNIEMPFIRDGIDVQAYRAKESKEVLREKLNIPKDKTVFVYGGAFRKIKNQEFLIKCACESGILNKSVIVLLGDGPDYKTLFKRYADNKNIVFTGRVNNVAEYLGAADYYVSTSKSEGLPNNVLEALAAGLFVIVSDIKQHLEILNVESGLGVAYESGNKADFIKVFADAVKGYDFSPEKNARAAEKYFSSERMAEEYADLYYKIYRETRG